MKARELRRWAEAWLRNDNHFFHLMEYGSVSIRCENCSLMIYARGFVHHPIADWVSCTDKLNPNPQQLYMMMEKIPYNCSEFQIIDTMDQ